MPKTTRNYSRRGGKIQTNPEEADAGAAEVEGDGGTTVRAVLGVLGALRGWGGPPSRSDRGAGAASAGAGAGADRMVAMDASAL